MSAEILRRAASLMRERAERLTPGPWVPFKYIVGGGANNGDIASTWPDPQGIYADHIASWHPAVALAVADWLDAEVPRAEYRERQQRETSAWLREGVDPYPVHYDRETQKAIAAARAYLGESA